MQQLIPILTREIQQESTVRCCNARDLHAFLEVRRVFSTWIKYRIEQYGFVEGEDFIVVQNLSSPNLVSSNINQLPSADTKSAKSRQQQMVDYHITLDMAKELAMVENNDIGRKVRRYFIQVEKKARELLEIRANRELPLPQVKAMLKDNLQLKTLFALQKQAIEIARQLDKAEGEHERKVLYSILCYIHTSMGMAAPEPDSSLEEGLFI